MPIPHLIHQVGPDGDLPPAYDVAWRQSWADAHPSWAYRLWRDADLLALAAASYPAFAPVFDDAGTPGVVKGDFGRLLVLYDRGGVYADLDYVCLRPLDALLDGRAVILSQMARRTSPASGTPFDRFIHNAAMAAVPGHPLVKAVLDDALATWAAGEKRNAPSIAGSQALMNRLRLYAGDDVYVSPPAELCPVSFSPAAGGNVRLQYADDTIEQYRTFWPDAYAVTFWMHQW